MHCVCSSSSSPGNSVFASATAAAAGTPPARVCVLAPSTRLTFPQLAIVRPCPRALHQVLRTCSLSTSTPATARPLSRRHLGALARCAPPPRTAGISQQQHATGAPSATATALTAGLPPRHSRAYRYQHRPLASAIATSPSRLHPLPRRLRCVLLRTSPPAAPTSPSRHCHCPASIRQLSTSPSRHPGHWVPHHPCVDAAIAQSQSSANIRITLRLRIANISQRLSCSRSRITMGKPAY